jgi:hypothetical protein
MAAIMQTRRESPQFGRASVRVTHFRQQIHFSFRKLGFGEFGDEKKFASFSPEFPVLTRALPALRTSFVGLDDMMSVAPALFEERSICRRKSGRQSGRVCKADCTGASPHRARQRERRSARRVKC